MKREKTKKPLRQRMLLSFLLLALALVSVTAVTVAWFSIADNTRVRSISMNVTSGVALRIDLDAHDDFMEYVKVLTFGQIAQRIRQEKGFDMTETPLEPVTTSDGISFTFRDGSPADSQSGVYLEFTLHFMAQEDMVVHLTSSDFSEEMKGTRINSETAGLDVAMRISFTYDGTTYIFDPGMGDFSKEISNGKIFGIPSAGNMVYNDVNAMFSLQSGVDAPVVVRIWLEGEDEACTNALKGSDYSIRLRFEGTTEDHQRFSTADRHG